MRHQRRRRTAGPAALHAERNVSSELAWRQWAMPVESAHLLAGWIETGRRRQDFCEALTFKQALVILLV